MLSLICTYIPGICNFLKSGFVGCKFSSICKCVICSNRKEYSPSWIVDKVLNIPKDTSSSIHHRFDIEILRRKCVDISANFKRQTTWKRWHRFNVDNSTSIQLSKSMKYRQIFCLDFSMSFRCWIDIASKLVVWRKTGSRFHFVMWEVSPLSIYSKLNLKFEICKMLLNRCNFNVKWTWGSNKDIPFILKWH